MNCCSRALDTILNNIIIDAETNDPYPSVGFHAKCTGFGHVALNLLGITGSVIWLKVAKISKLPYLPYIAMVGMITGLFRIIICSWGYKISTNELKLTHYKFQIIRGIAEMAGLGVIILIGDIAINLFLKFRTE